MGATSCRWDGRPTFILHAGITCLITNSISTFPRCYYSDSGKKTCNGRILRQTKTKMAINDTLSGVGEGLGDLFDGLAEPLGNFLIIIGIAGGVVALFMAIASRVKSGL